MAVASKRYSGIDGLGASEVSFNFFGEDENTVLAAAYRNRKVLAPSDKDWAIAANSEQALEAYNIARYGKPTGQTSIKVAADDILDNTYKRLLANESNVETDPKLTGTSDRNFYNGGPRAFRPPSKVSYPTAVSTAALSYPYNIDLGQDHLQINKFEYSRDGQVNRSKGPDRRGNPGDRISRNKTSKGTVILPMPKVSDSNGAEWGESDLNVFGIAGLNLLDQTAQSVQNTLSGGFNLGSNVESLIKAGKFPNINKNALQGFGDDLAGSFQVGGALIGSELLKSLGITVSPDQILARTEGNIINPNAELLFQGPVLRDFGFQYLMVARSKEEGDQIRKIIRFFKEGSAPKYQSQALLGTPDIFTLEYKTPGNPGIMNKFNDLALRTITVDYAPDGFWTAYEDSHPVAVRMNLQFTELRPVYASDHERTPANSVGY